MPAKGTECSTSLSAVTVMRPSDMSTLAFRSRVRSPVPTSVRASKITGFRSLTGTAAAGAATDPPRAAGAALVAGATAGVRGLAVVAPGGAVAAGGDADDAAFAATTGA